MVERSKLFLLLAATAAIGAAGCQKSDSGGGGTGGTATVDGGTGGTATVDGGTGGIVSAGGTTPDAALNAGGSTGGAAGGNVDTGGTTGGSTGGAVGGAVVPPGGTIEIGAACNPDDDQCVDGASCIGDAGMGTCYRSCDTAADPTGCESDEYCYAQGDCAADAASCPGFCIPSDDCEPCDASVACGGEAASCWSLAPATLCAPAGTQDIGGVCQSGDLASDDPANYCKENLVCAFGKCASPCGAGTDTCGPGGACGHGEICADYGFKTNGLNYTFCYKGCGLGSQTGCADGEFCTVYDNAQVGDNVVMLNSCQQGEQGMKRQGDSCTPADANYWGDCTAGNLCADVFGDRPTICNGLCDHLDQTACLGATGCYFGLFKLEGLGICLGECDPFGDAAACGDGKKCEVFNVGLGAEGEKVLGMCQDGAATKQTGEECTADQNTGASDCAAGNLCIQIAQGDPPVCIQVCDNDPASTHTCAPGNTCMTGTLGAQDARSERWGLCVPQQ